MQVYRYQPVKFSQNTPIYFIDEAANNPAVLKNLKSSSNLKLIASSGLGSTHTKLKLVDFMVS